MTDIKHQDKKKILLIENKYPCHYEIVESVILKYDTLFDFDIQDNIIICVNMYYKNIIFFKYIKYKYPNIIFGRPKQFDYYVDLTIYPHHFLKIYNPNKSNKKYICHRVLPQLFKDPNIFFLTPLAKQNVFNADCLPFSEYSLKKHIPIFVIQGNLCKKRRHYPLLIKILHNSYKYPFIIKMIGRGTIPNELEPYKDKIIFRQNLNFVDYHKEFISSYCIIPLITKKSHPQYYKSTLTSSINYAKAYKLKCLIDKDLQDIYKLSDVEIFNDKNDITKAFQNTLEQFYNKNKTK